jgi:hypothetical protein
LPLVAAGLLNGDTATQFQAQTMQGADMSDNYPVGLPSSNDPFSDDDELDDATITESARLTDDDFVGEDDYVGDDDAIDTSADDLR